MAPTNKTTRASTSNRAPNWPFDEADAVTYDVDFTQMSLVWCGSAGNVSVRTASGADRVFKGLQAGQVVPCFAQRVNTTGTTVPAADLLAGW